jgi:hypothetical protein
VAPSSTGDTRLRDAQNTISEQWIAPAMAPEPCEARRTRALIRLREPPPELSRIDFQRSKESPARSPGRKSGLPDVRMNRTGFKQPRDRAQFVSFNFLNPPICTVASSAHAGCADLVTRACHYGEPK